MSEKETLKLFRDVTAIEIPAGTPVELQKDSLVTITQNLGGSYTVVTDRGFLARIDAKDADALGKEIENKDSGVSKDQPLEKQVWDVLRTIYDPEIPVNIVELGLVYVCDVFKEESGKYSVEIKMTLTAPGCGMGDVLKRDAEVKVQELEEVEKVDVEIVFDPPWDQSRMSEAARLQLGFY